MQEGTLRHSFLRLTRLIPVSVNKSAGLGADAGLKKFAVLSDGREYPNINKSSRMKKLMKRLKREQRKFSRKIKKLLQRKKETADKKCKRSNLDKQRLKVQRAHRTSSRRTG